MVHSHILSASVQTTESLVVSEPLGESKALFVLGHLYCDVHGFFAAAAPNNA